MYLAFSNPYHFMINIIFDLLLLFENFIRIGIWVYLYNFLLNPNLILSLTYNTF